MWTDAALENWRLRQRVELSTKFERGSDTVGVNRQYQEADAAAGPAPDDAVPAPSNPSPYERVQSGNGVVRFKLKPVEVVQLPIPALLGQGGRAVRVTP
ncbi:MAG: hypothetical protein O6831_03940 [Alphaproteobacteria bacterium]|nr:hypothetical protein [Alphaproteobacteria bacterium]